MPFNVESIDELCHALDISRQDLAFMLGVRRNTIYMWESEKATPRLKSIDALYELANKHELYNIVFYEEPVSKDWRKQVNFGLGPARNLDEAVMIHQGVRILED